MDVQDDAGLAALIREVADLDRTLFPVDPIIDQWRKALEPGLEAVIDADLIDLSCLRNWAFPSGRP